VSLISEALRKARAEAAEREGREHGVPRALALPPKRWRSGPGVLLLAIAGLAAGLGGAAVAWWALGRRPGAATPVPVPTSPATPAPAAATAAAGMGTTALHHAPLPGAAVPAPTSAPKPAVAAAPPKAAPPRADASEARAEQARRPEGERSGGVGEHAERTFVIDADLGYAKLHLDFIVYRPGSPFASINGAQVMVGSLLEGFTVEEIGQDFVRLRDKHGAVVLRVR
jgi:hypothetical protein